MHTPTCRLWCPVFKIVSQHPIFPLTRPVSSTRPCKLIIYQGTTKFNVAPPAVPFGSGVCSDSDCPAKTLKANGTGGRCFFLTRQDPTPAWSLKSSVSRHRRRIGRRVIDTGQGQCNTSAADLAAIRTLASSFVALLLGASRPKTAAAPLFRGSPLRREWVRIRASPPSRRPAPMTTSPDTLIYCFKCKDQDRVQRPGAGGPEEPPRRHPGRLRRLRHQEVPHRQAGLTRAVTSTHRRSRTTEPAEPETPPRQPVQRQAKDRPRAVLPSSQASPESTRRSPRRAGLGEFRPSGHQDYPMALRSGTLASQHARFPPIALISSKITDFGKPAFIPGSPAHGRCLGQPMGELLPKGPMRL